MKLEQKGFLKGSQTFEIGDNEIVVRWKHGRQYREFKVPLNVIAKNSEYHKGSDTLFLVLSILCAIVSVIFIISLFYVDMKDTGAIGFMLAFLIIIGAVAFGSHQKKSYDCLIHYNMFSGHPALVFWRDKPNKETFAAFIDQLNDKLSKQKNGYVNAAQEAGMTSEIRKLHELWEQGILSEEEFKAGKARILGIEGSEWKY